MAQFKDFVLLALRQTNGSYGDLAKRTGFTARQLFNFSAGAPPAAGIADGRSLTPADDPRYLELGRASAEASEDTEASARACAEVAEAEFRCRAKPNRELFHDEIDRLLTLGLRAEAIPQAQELLLRVMQAGHAMTAGEIRDLSEVANKQG